MEFEKENYKVKQFTTTCLGHFSYLIISNNECAILDPLRDNQQYVDYITKHSLKLKYIIETHFHADFVSGHVPLSQKTGATIIYGKNTGAKFDHKQVEDQEELSLGKIKLRFMSTPGHTLESICIIIGQKNQEEFIFTGDTLFCGDAGRPDLASDSLKNITVRDLTDHLFDSLQKIKQLNINCVVLPGHGAGSPCGKKISSSLSTTIKNELEINYSMKINNKDEFHKAMINGLSPPPQYFFYNVKLNQNNQEIVDSNELIKNKVFLNVEQFKDKIKQNIQVLDTRNFSDFQEGFIPGSINIPLDSKFAIFTASILHFEQPILLVNDEGMDDQVITRLARTGLHNIEGVLQGGFENWKNSKQLFEKAVTISPKEIVEKIENGKLNGKILDVRNVNEWLEGVVQGSELLNLNVLKDEAKNKLDKNQIYYITCRGGARGGMALGLLRKQGFNVINIEKGYMGMLNSGLTKIEKDPIY